MKKIFGALAAVVLTALTMPSQAQIRWGVKGGVNLSKAGLSDIRGNFKKDNFTGFFIGPMAEVAVPIVGLGVDASLLFSQRGVRMGEASEGYTTIKQNGIDVPVNLKYTFGLGSLAGIYVAAGPDFYFDFEKKTGVDKKKAEVGINLGTGLRLLKHLQVGANYNIPLGDTADVLEGSYKTKTWQVSAAYVF